MDRLGMMFSQFYQKKRVLVTGHTGFKGSWLSAWLSMLGAEVTGLALPPEHEEDHFVLLNLEKHMTHREGDIRDLGEIQRVLEEIHPEIVFHLAAQSLVQRGFEDPKVTFDTNVGGSVNLLEAVRAVPSVRVLIYVTSDKCYRNKEWIWGYRENDELGGKDPYSASKACAEHVLSSYLASFFNTNPHVRAASVRAGNVIGGGDWAEDRIVPDCIRALRDGSNVVLRNPDARRPWQHVLDPLRGYLMLAEKLFTEPSSLYTGAWNFGPDKESNRTVMELAAIIVEAWGSDLKIMTQKNNSIEPPEAQLLYLNWDKAYQMLGWQPIWDFHQAMRHTLEWYKHWTQGADIWDLTAGQIRTYMEDYKQKGKVS